MTIPQIGIVHPGDMGIYVAVTMKNSNCDLFWASDGRSSATTQRAEKQGLMDVGDLASLCSQCGVIVSVCPPHGALDVARDVVACGFRGLYIDANAISPMKAKTLRKY